MQSPNSELLKALYTQLTDSLPYPVYLYYTPNMVTPCVVLAQFDGGQDNHKECKGTNTTFLVECVKDYNTTLSLVEMFDFENEVVSYLTENRLTINNQNQVDIFWTNSIDQNENLQDGTLRVRRLLRFRILLQQNFETYIYKWLIGYDNGNFGFFNPTYGDLQPRNDYTALYLLDNKLIANNSTNTAPSISLDIKGYSNTVNLNRNTPNGDYSNYVDNTLRDLIINHTGDYLYLDINNSTTSHTLSIEKSPTNNERGYILNSYGNLNPKTLGSNTITRYSTGNIDQSQIVIQLTGGNYPNFINSVINNVENIIVSPENGLFAKSSINAEFITQNEGKNIEVGIYPLTTSHAMKVGQSGTSDSYGFVTSAYGELSPNTLQGVIIVELIGNASSGSLIATMNQVVGFNTIYITINNKTVDLTWVSGGYQGSDLETTQYLQSNKDKVIGMDISTTN